MASLPPASARGPTMATGRNRRKRRTGSAPQRQLDNKKPPGDRRFLFLLIVQ
jgi:hypothetical protein